MNIRSFGTHVSRVKSAALDKWTAANLRWMRAGGNQILEELLGRVCFWSFHPTFFPSTSHIVFLSFYSSSHHPRTCLCCVDEHDCTTPTARCANFHLTISFFQYVFPDWYTVHELYHTNAVEWYRGCLQKKVEESNGTGNMWHGNVAPNDVGIPPSDQDAIGLIACYRPPVCPRKSRSVLSSERILPGGGRGLQPIQEKREKKRFCCFARKKRSSPSGFHAVNVT